MSRVVLDTQLRAQLNGLQEGLEFCDENGKTLGHFVPVPVYHELMAAWSKAHLSDAELQSRRDEPKGRTLAEIWKRLGQA
jgi:hypothetical protein